jgi:hypothetical protein
MLAAVKICQDLCKAKSKVYWTLIKLIKDKINIITFG